MDYYYDTNGGTEGQLLELIKGLDRNLFDPHLFVFRPTEFVKKNNGFPCPITVLNVGKLARIDTILKLIKLSYLIRKENFKIVHIFFNDASIIAPLFCKIGGANVIVSRRDMGFWYTPSQLRAIKISNLFVDRIVVNSKAVMANVSKWEGFSIDKINIIYNGHDPKRFDVLALLNFRESLGIADSDPIIGMAASLYKIKRHSDLIHAFSIIHGEYKNAHLVLIGSGPMEYELKSLTYTLGLCNSIHFLGDIKEVIPIIKHFSVGVLCSESEGLSNAILEYMMCGIPAVCTNVGGNPEIIKDGFNGFLIPVGDINQLADRISKILSDSSLSEFMSQNAMQTAEKFLLKKMIDSHTNLYFQLLSQKNLLENAPDTSYYR